MNPTRLSAKSTILFDMPPYPIREPASMKKGIASNGNESIPVNAVWAIIITGIVLVKYIVIIVARPSAIPIGTLSERNMKSRDINRAMSIISPPI